MKVQVYLIAILLSLVLWGLSFDITRDIYRDAHQAGYMPNLHLKSHVRKALDWPPRGDGASVG